LPNLTRRIGLSLGADDCWPICYEDILKKLDLSLEIKGDTIDFEVERIKIAPFALHEPVKYDVVLDRLTHWYHLSREWIKKAILLDEMYVLNNPWSVQSMEKHTSYCAMIKLGMPIPTTWLIPPKENDEQPDLQKTLERYADMFELEDVGGSVGYPSYLKPYDGGGWVGVNRVEDTERLQQSYDDSGKFVMHLQRSVEGFERFVRTVGVGPQARFVDYDPSAPLHLRYTKNRDFLTDDDASLLRDTLLTINSFFGWDFNSCECLLKEGTWHPIDFANPCPDSQVTSLHIHFPWLIKAKLRWSLFCAATKKKMRVNLDWTPYFEVAERELPYREKLREYAAIARTRFETDRFDEFCETHLPHLDDVAWDYFGTDKAKDAVRLKVVALFPEHEWDEFTDHFWAEIQSWRNDDAAHGQPASAQ
jgi:hypothetical protein